MEYANTRILEKAERVLALSRKQSLSIATAESCTGGLVAAALTEIPGSSDAFECGFVTYSNEAKNALLGVPITMIEQHGAVSKAVAGAMSDGALSHSRAGISVAVTGIAGPGGGSEKKPVGLVWFAVSVRGRPAMAVSRTLDPVSRSAVRQASVETALDLLDRALTTDR